MWRMGDRAVLLVEFVDKEGFIGLINMHFIKGFLNILNIPCEWIRLPITPSPYLTYEGIHISTRVRRDLLKIMRSLSCTHILFSQPPDRESIEKMGNFNIGAIEQTKPLEQAQDMGRWFLLPPLPDRIIRWILGGEFPLNMPTIPPVDYSYKTLGQFEGKIRPFFFVLAGQSCTWKKKLPSIFREMEGIASGCTFCSTRLAFDPYLKAIQEKVNRDQLLEIQIMGLVTVLPNLEERPSCRIIGQDIDPRVIVQRFLNLGVSNTDIVLEFRPDHLISRKTQIEEALAYLDNSNNRIVLGLMGIESFSENQLLRYNKGTSPEINLLAIKTLFELADKKNIVIKESSVLSFILYDPWSSPVEVGHNISVVRHLSLYKFARRFLSSRLRLYEQTPLYYLAKQEGLILERYENPLFDTSRKTLYPKEIPWRFKDPKMDKLCSSLIVLEKANRDTKGQKHRIDDFLALAEALCHATLQGHKKRVEKIAHTLIPPSPPLEFIFPFGKKDNFTQFQHYLEFGLFDMGLKPVMKIEEPYSPLTLDIRVKQILQAWHSVHIKTRIPRWGHRKVVEIFVGWKERDVNRAYDISRALDKIHDTQILKDATIEFGDLMGYPKCCVLRYADLGRVTSKDLERLRVFQRLTHSQVTLPDFFPIFVPHLPCSIECPETRAMIDALKSSPNRWIEGWAETYMVDRSLKWQDLGAFPTIYFWERGGQFIVIRPILVSENMIRYKTVLVFTSDLRAKAVLHGDTLMIRGGLITVMRGEREIGFLGCDVFLWEKTMVRNLAFQKAVHELSQIVKDNGMLDEILLQIREAIKEMESDPKNPLAGFRLNLIERHPHGKGFGRVLVNLQRGCESLRLHIYPKVSNSPHYFETQHLLISHDKTTEVDTDEKRKVIIAIGERLDKIWRLKHWS